MAPKSSDAQNATDLRASIDHMSASISGTSFVGNEGNFMIHTRAFLLVMACHLVVQTGTHAAERTTPLIVGHRGLLLHAPENTLPNFRACLELRLGFEFDVQRTQDGALVCIHDATLDRTTNGSGQVANLTLAQIREFDAGSWFDPKFAGEKVPTVDEVLMLVAEHKQQEVLIAVDLKAENIEADVVRLAEKHGVLDRLLFIGRTITEPMVRRAIRKASGKAHVGILANNPAELQKAISDPDAEWVYLRYFPSKVEMSAVRDSGKSSFITIAGVDLPDNWHHAAAVGIDAILTDYPLNLRKALRSR
ncbi:MAG TPA: glycerophosphodiester phosphodiesterase family protein [Pirellulales bacterium]|nr:glycerophosphodiester phosphodiesterase family protein [Pirellulales bacterium]